MDKNLRTLLLIALTFAGFLFAGRANAQVGPSDLCSYKACNVNTLTVLNSTAASAGITLSTAVNICLNGSGCTAYLRGQAGGEIYLNGGAVGIISSGFVTHGAASALAGPAGDPVVAQGSPADGATAVATVLKSQSTLANASAKIVSIRNASSEVAYFGPTGGLVVVGVTASNNAVDLGVDLARLKGGTHANGWLSFNSSGTLATGGSIQAGVNVSHGAASSFNGPAGNTVSIQGSVADGATAVSVVLRSSVNLTTAGAKLVSIRNSTSNEVVALPWEGGIQLNVQGTAEPSCVEARRGEIIYVRGGVGVAETIRACLKDPTDESYAWYTMVTSS